METTPSPLTEMISTDSIGVICDFLDVIDVIKLQWTCKYLNGVAKQPHSFYRLDVRQKCDEPYYLGPRFSEVKHLVIYTEKQLQFNLKCGEGIISLTVISRFGEDSATDPNNDHIWFAEFPYFSVLQRFNSSYNTPYLLTHNKINLNTLKHLRLNDCRLDYDLILSIIQCNNLEILELIPAMDDYAIFRSEFQVLERINDNEIFTKFESNALMKLRYFETNVVLGYMPNFVHWLLSGKRDKIQFKFDECVYGHCLWKNITKLFANSSKFGLSALCNIRAITIDGVIERESVHVTHLLLDNICECIQLNDEKVIQIDHFVIYFGIRDLYSFGNDFDYIELKETICSIQQISAYCNCSKISIFLQVADVYHFIDDDPLWFNNWILNEIKTNQKQICDKLTICLRYNFGRIKKTDNMQELEKEITKFAMKFMNHYNKYFKQWLQINKDDMIRNGMRKISVIISFNGFSGIRWYMNDKKCGEALKNKVVQIIEQKYDDCCKIRKGEAIDVIFYV